MPTVVGIDGYFGAGKSTFAKYYSDVTGALVISIDDYVRRNEGSYVESLDSFSLQAEMQAALRSSVDLIILEGLCLRKISYIIGLKIDFHIYVDKPEGLKRNNINAYLYDEVYVYHKRIKPRENADWIIEMVNSPLSTTYDVDIAFINAQSRLSTILALGGILSLLVGVFIFSTGVSGSDETTVEILGANLNSKGLGGVVMTTSVLWAYIAFLARPKYRRRHEIVSGPDENSFESRREIVEASIAITSNSINLTNPKKDDVVF